MELIDKATIVAEIEKRIEDCNKWADAAAEKNLHNTLEANELVIQQYKSLLSFIHTLEAKEVDLQSEVTKWLRNNENVIHMEFARHFFNLGLKAKEKYIKDIPLQCWQIPCADPNYPCENSQMDCINCPRFGHPQGTITMTNMEE